MIFEIRFQRRISGYGGPGSPWAREYLYLEAKDKREANKFFQTLIRLPDYNRHLYGYGLMNRELGTYYRAVEVQSVNVGYFTSFSTFEPRVYTQAELTTMRVESDAVLARSLKQRDGT